MVARLVRIARNAAPAGVAVVALAAGAVCTEPTERGSRPVQRRVPTPRPSPPTLPIEAVRLNIAATGDILIHSPVAMAMRGPGLTGYDFDPVFAGVRRTIRGADLAICHLETPVSRTNSDLSYYPIFRVPRQVVSALARAGYDYCSTASNHALDAGLDGVRATLDLLDRAGVAHDGTARTRREGASLARLNVKGVRIALASYTYGLNGFTPPAGAWWAVNLIDVPRILRDARRARDRGAELVIVSLHWGTEYVVDPSLDQRRIARRIMETGLVDAIIGHHAHVVQPVDRIDGRVVAYGLGNFVSNQSYACCPAATQDGVILHLLARERRGRVDIRRVLYTPTWMSHDPYRIVLIKVTSNLPTTLRDSAARTRASLRILGNRPRPASGVSRS